MLRGKEVSRIEGFSDAVFGFSLTLLVVSLEVPESFADLQTIIAGFPAFAVTFAVICWVWYEHFLLFRRYDMEDGLSVVLNCTLLFLVVFYAYPLKFIFARLITGNVFGIGPGIGAGMSADDARELLMLYSGGFVALFGTLLLFYANALRQRVALNLDPPAIFDAVSHMWRHAISAGLGLVSVALAAFLPIGYLAFAGLIFFLLGPMHGLYGYMNARRRERLEAAGWLRSGTPQPVPTSAGESDR